VIFKLQKPLLHHVCEYFRDTLVADLGSWGR